MDESRLKFVAYTVRGLERICEDELGSRVAGFASLSLAPKQVRFSAPLNADLLRSVRTVDDIGLELAQPIELTSPDQLSDLVAGLDLDLARQTLASVRGFASDAVSITPTVRTSPLGNATAVAELAAAALTAKGVDVVTGERAPLDLRVFVNGSTVGVGARLFEEPLFHRPYRVANVRGAIRPTVAAAMLWIADPAPGSTVWDPFCGSGTILCEADALGFDVAGSDIDPVVVDVARRALPNASLDVADARDGSGWRGHVDSALVTNMPWNHQVKSDKGLAGAIGDGLGRRAAHGGGACVLVTNADRMLRIADRRAGGVGVARGTLGLLGQTPELVLLDAKSPGDESPGLSRARALLARVDEPV